MSHTVSVSVRMKVPFYDVDMMHVVWNGNYQKYFEIARQALFTECGLDLYQYIKEKQWVLPVIRSTVKHIHPLRFGDEFICTATLKEARVRIVMDFEIRRTADGKVCAKGRSEQAAVRLPDMEMSFKIPEEIRDALRSKDGQG